MPSLSAGRPTTAGRLSESTRGLISLAICVHLAVLLIGLLSNVDSSRLQQRFLEITAPYGVTLGLVPYSARFHWTQGAPLDDDHQLVVRPLTPAGTPLENSAVNTVELGGESLSAAGDLVLGLSYLDRVWFRRLARRLAEYQQGDDTDTAAILAESVAARVMRRASTSRVQVRAQRLEPLVLEGGGATRGAVAEHSFAADVVLDQQGRPLVVTETPPAEAAEAVVSP